MDRISLLPESLIAMILDLIPLQDAVRTSVLSTGWLDSWRSRPNIDINQDLFPSPAACLRFATAWITHYPLGPLATIHSFSLKFSSPHIRHAPVLNGFIRFAIDRQTPTLELDFTPAAGNHDGTFELPDFVYQYHGLETLHLSSCRFRVFNSVNISMLKTVSLDRVALPNSAVLRLSWENLSLIRCSEGDLLGLVAPRLRSLVIENCLDLMSIAVAAENLRRFKYVGEMVAFGFTRMRLLEEADVDLMPATLFVDEQPGEEIHDLLMNFFHANVLSVCSYVTQVISAASDPFNLPRSLAAKSLTIKSGFQDDELCGIGTLLNGCPSLEQLRFILTETKYLEDDDGILPYEVDPEAFWGEEFTAPASILSSIQEIEIDGFGEKDNVFPFLRFVVQNGGVLRKIRLKLERDEEGDWVQLAKDLPRIIRAWRYRSPYEVDLLIE